MIKYYTRDDDIECIYKHIDNNMYYLSNGTWNDCMGQGKYSTVTLKACPHLIPISEEDLMVELL